ncbi:MAG: hypothetical protein IKY16_04920 [Bacteroidales bacterium]|nr:hypothetical protein [Bacteroidales bacterium]
MEKRQESNSNKGNLGLNIGIATYKVLTTDPPKVKQLKEAIKRIDEVLKSGYSDLLLYENQSACSEFPEIVFARQSEVTRTTEEFMRSQPQYIQYESLKAIGLVLYDAVKASKAIQTFEEASKVALKTAGEDLLGLLSDR